MYNIIKDYHVNFILLSHVQQSLLLQTYWFIINITWDLKYICEFLLFGYIPKVIQIHLCICVIQTTEEKVLQSILSITSFYIEFTVNRTFKSNQTVLCVKLDHAFCLIHYFINQLD